MAATRKRRLWILAEVVVILGGFAGLLCLALRDEPPAPDADLRVVRRSVLDADNGFSTMDIVASPPYWPDDDENIQLASQTFDLKAAKEVVEQNTAVFVRLDDCLRKPDFQEPELLSVTDPLPDLLASRTLAYAISCHQRVLFESGREKEAFEVAMKAVRLGHRIEGAQGASIHYLVGAAIKDIGLNNILWLIERTSLAPTDLKPLITDLGHFPANREGLADALRLEYVLCSRVLEDQQDLESLGLRGLGSWITRRPFVKTEQTKRLFAEDIRALITETPKAASERKLPDVQAKYDESHRWHWLLSNGPGKAILLQLVRSFEGSLTTIDNEDVSVSAVRVLIALKCFKLERGNLPASLDDLVPVYLERVPLDPFDGKPLRYSAEKRIVYSVGKDFEDSGGSIEKAPGAAREDNSEPTFRIGF